MSISLVLVLLAVLAFGILLVLWGIHGRRLNRDPVCRDCGFNLSSKAQGTVTCPECGGGLKRRKAVRIGERKRMPLMIFVGCVLALLGISPLAGLAFAFASGRSVAKYLPTGILISISNGANREVARELESRVVLKSLSPDQLDRVIDHAIELQGDWNSPWDPAWGDVYEAAVMSGRVISPERKERWAAQSLNLKAKPRSLVNSRDPVVLRLLIDGVRINPSGNARFNARFESFTIDGVDVLNNISAGEKANTKAFFSVNGTSNRGYDSAMSHDVFVRLPEKPPGTYPFVATVLLQPESSRGPTSTSRFARRQEFRGTITVLPDEQPTVTPAAATTLDRDQIRQFLAMNEMVLTLSGWSTAADGVITPNQWTFETDFPWNNEPRIPLAFQVWLIDADGQRVRIGRLASESYEDASGVSSATPRLESKVGAQVELRGPVSLVFLPDVQIAKETFGLTQYFGEEIRFDNLPLLWSPEYGYKQKFTTAQEVVEARQKIKRP